MKTTRKYHSKRHGGKMFAEITPPKDKKVCSNCSYWFGWGVQTGMCVQLNQDTNQSYTCDKFDLTENNEQ